MAATTDRSGRVAWSSAIWAGLIAGAVFLMVEMILLPLFGLGGPWGPPRMMAAMVLGQGVLEPMTFDLGIVALAMMIHAVLSVGYALLLALIVHRMSTPSAVLAGGGLGRSRSRSSGSRNATCAYGTPCSSAPSCSITPTCACRAAWTARCAAPS